MPYLRIYIHLVWRTKNHRQVFTSPESRQMIWAHMRENAKEKGIFVDVISGYTDHCHCLISLGTDQTIQKVVQLLKGESSHWINKNEEMKQFIGNQKFEWQDKYFAVSVSESIVGKVREYINNQETHHKKKTFQEEYDEFITKYKFSQTYDGDREFG